MLIKASIINYTTTEGQVELSWTAVSGADYYKIYRTTVAPKSGGMTFAERLGFLGIAYGPTFTDTNITPDFTSTPPQGYNPFADGRVNYINITNGGSGYSQNTATCSVSGGGGSGFIGYPIVDSSGSIVGVVIISGGSGYSSASVSFGGGSGATGTVSLSASSGNNPRASKIFQQRQLFGGTDNQPLGIWGSKPGYFNNFDISTIPVDSDSYEFETRQ